jgi:hypothetical protein
MIEMLLGFALAAALTQTLVPRNQQLINLLGSVSRLSVLFTRCGCPEGRVICIRKGKHDQCLLVAGNRRDMRKAKLELMSMAIQRYI